MSTLVASAIFSAMSWYHLSSFAYFFFFFSSRRRHTRSDRDWSSDVCSSDLTFVTAPLSRFSISDDPPDDSQFGAIAPMLLGMAAVVLLVACLNLANMLLARGTARRKEIAIRLALGGGRWRGGRQLLAEGLLPALLGGG